MLDALKGLGGSGKAHKQSEDLQSLISTAKEERSALSAMLTQISMRTAKVTQMAKTLEQVDEKASSATGKLDSIAKRIEGLEQQAKSFGEVEERVLTLIETATTAQQTAEKIMAPNGELEKHRRQVQQLSSQALETQASVDALKKERAALEEFRNQLRQSQVEIKQSVDQAASLRGDLDQVRGTAGVLNQDYAKLRETVREAREDSSAATEAVKEVEKKLGPLMQLQELSKTTEEKLTSLNALAEHVNQKAKALEGQKHTIDRAVVEANRLNEMVWSMDVQIGKLNEGLKQASKSEESIAKIEKIVEETNSKIDVATKIRDEFTRETARMEKDGRALVDVMRTYVEKLALEKKEFEAFDLRLRALQGSVHEAEGKMEALASKERNLAQLNQLISSLGKDFQALAGQADELSKKQTSLETLQERLAQVDELTKRTAAQYESLRLSRTDLEKLRKEIQDFHKSHADVAHLRDRLSADRAALETFGDRLTSFKARTPELEATMDAILGKLTLVDEGTKQATKLGEVASDLDAQLTRVTGRIQFVEKLEGRMNTLHSVTVEVDRKLAEQLARRADLDTLKTQCDGVIAQMLDAHQKIEAVGALQTKILPMSNRLSVLQDRIEKAGASVKEVQRDEAVLTEQDVRLTELVETGRTLAADTAERMKQTQALTEELARSGAAKDELIAELARIQTRQRDAVAQAEAAEDQLKRAEAMYKSLEQRRSQLAFSEKKLAGVESRLAELGQKPAEIEQKMKALAERETLVNSVKAEVDTVHQISAKSRADLQFVSDQREEVASMRRQVQDLLAKAGETEDKIGIIEARRKTVDEVQAKTNLIANLLEDVKVNLETLGEQKAVIDHLTDKLARLEFVMQEAQNTLRMLTHERELAERIEQSIKQLRTRSTSKAEDGRQASA